MATQPQQPFNTWVPAPGATVKTQHHHSPSSGFSYSSQPVSPSWAPTTPGAPHIPQYAGSCVSPSSTGSSFYCASGASSFSHRSTPYYQHGGDAAVLAGAAQAGVLVVYGTNMLGNPAAANSLLGLYYDDQVHGPWASGCAANPFTPGLAPPASAKASRPAYAVEDPVKQRFPAARAAADPLNWITEDLFNVSEHVAESALKRTPIKSISARM